MKIKTIKLSINELKILKLFEGMKVEFTTSEEKTLVLMYKNKSVYEFRKNNPTPLPILVKIGD